jgi:tyrosine aminotransferase
VKAGLISLSTLILGANSLVQSLLPTILQETPQSFFTETMGLLHSNTLFLYSRLEKIPGLNPIMPDGAMYLMFGVDVRAFVGIEDDVEFCRQLLEEQSLVILPGEVFGMRFFVRLVVCAPMKVLADACDRIEVGSVSCVVRCSPKCSLSLDRTHWPLFSPLCVCIFCFVFCSLNR